MRGLRIGLTVAVLAMAAAFGVVSVVSGHSRSPAGSSAATMHRLPGELRAGVAIDRPLPHLGLVDQAGSPTSLGAFRGRWLIFAPTMTSCHEVCPVTSGALLGLRRELRRAGLARRVAVGEVTVDPWRDTPRRLRAYRRRFGVNLQLLTGSPAQVLRLWHILGIYVHRVVNPPPGDLDWFTHRHTRADVVHGDGIFVVDPSGHEREAALGMPDVHGHLSRRLRTLLDAEGRHNLAHPRLPWTGAQVVSDLRTLMARERR